MLDSVSTKAGEHHRYRRCVTFVFALVAVPSFAAAQGYASWEGLGGTIVRMFWLSASIASALFIAMVVNQKTRSLVIYPLVLGLLCAAPYIMFSVGIGGGIRNLTVVYTMIQAQLAPWIFIVSAIVTIMVALVSGRLTKDPSEKVSNPAESTSRKSFWLALNLALPVAALLSNLPNMSISRWLLEIGPISNLILQLVPMSKLLLATIVIDYAVVAVILAVLFAVLRGHKWLNPGSRGKEIILLSNIAEVFRVFVVVAFPLYHDLNVAETQARIARAELLSLYFWPISFLALTGFITMLYFQFKTTRAVS